MLPLKPEQLKAMLPDANPFTLGAYIMPLNQAMMEFAINTKLRMAAFLAQLAHESGEFRYMQELASGIKYEGRKDLGNTKTGDGVRYKGRGPIQLTGRANYRKYGELLRLPLEEHPDIAASPQVGFRIAGCYWSLNGCNALADAGNMRAITKKINGGYNGLAHRMEYYNRALNVL